MDVTRPDIGGVEEDSAVMEVRRVELCDGIPFLRASLSWRPRHWRGSGHCALHHEDAPHS